MLCGISTFLKISNSYMTHVSHDPKLLLHHINLFFFKYPNLTFISQTFISGLLAKS